MVPRWVLLVGVLVPLEIAAALLVAGLPLILGTPNSRTYAAGPVRTALASTPTAAAASPDAFSVESTPTSTAVPPTPTASPEAALSPTPTDTPTPSPTATPSSTQVVSPAETVTPSPALATPSATPPPSFVVANTDGQGVNLRASPSTKAARLRTIPEGTVLVATGPSVSSEGAEWYPVRDPRGTSGWVQARFLATRPPA